MVLPATDWLAADAAAAALASLPWPPPYFRWEPVPRIRWSSMHATASCTTEDPVKLKVFQQLVYVCQETYLRLETYHVPSAFFNDEGWTRKLLLHLILGNALKLKKQPTGGTAL